MDCGLWIVDCGDWRVNWDCGRLGADDCTGKALAKVGSCVKITRREWKGGRGVGMMGSAQMFIGAARLAI